MQLARIAEPDGDWRAAREHLSELARDAASLGVELHGGDLADQAAALAGLMAGRYRYAGDAHDYDAFENANLIRVIERRQGLPVALGILWLHAGRAAGWAIRGINFPGHFLVALEHDAKLVVLDVFAGGRVLDRADLRRMLRRVYGERAELGPNMLGAMDNRDILLRLQTNIRSRLMALGQLQAASDCLADMLRLAPSEALMWQEAAVLHRRLEQVAAALRCYTRFLELAPAGETATRARTAMIELRARLN